MIDEKKLIEGLRNILAYDSYDEWDDEDVVNEVLLYEDFEIIKLINDQPKVREWIPVAERLPEESDADKYGYVLVTRFRDMVMRIKYTEVNPNNARAWMPLPEEYKEENEEK